MTAYVYQEFPKVKYHPTLGTKTVQNAAEENALGKGWYNTPAEFPKSSPQREISMPEINPISERLLAFANESVEDQVHYWRWYGQVRAFLETVAPQFLSDFDRLTRKGDVFVGLAGQQGMIEGAALKLKMATSGQTQAAPAAIEPDFTAAEPSPKKIFVVHGHDSDAKETVARFIEGLGLQPIILHEQPSSGRTLIEKFEVYADVGFAVVLLTPDDVGAAVSEKRKKLKPRARQNVVFELGYFVGKLTRSRVCALYKNGVEIPSDYWGVVYVELDDKKVWQRRLAQELSDAHLPINLEALLKS
jgi:predicted nucleotide-binding protein